MFRIIGFTFLLMLSSSSHAWVSSTPDYAHALNMVHWINNATNSYKIVDDRFYYMDRNASLLVKKYNEQVHKIKAHHQLENKSLRSTLDDQQKFILCSAGLVNASVQLFAWIEQHHTAAQGYDITLQGQSDIDHDGQKDEQTILYNYKLKALNYPYLTSQVALDSAQLLLWRWSSLLACETTHNKSLQLVQEHINAELFDSSFKRMLADWLQVVPDIDIRKDYFEEEIPFADDDLPIQTIASSAIDFIQQSIRLSSYKD